jgi:hypothetical protein
MHFLRRAARYSAHITGQLCSTTARTAWGTVNLSSEFFLLAALVYHDF